MTAAGPPSSGRSQVVGTVDHPVLGTSEVTSTVLTSELLTVEVWDFGARLVGVSVPDRHGDRSNVVLRDAQPTDYTRPRHGYLGASIGRYANRIAHSSIVVAGRRHELAPNEGDHQLHGGPIGFDQHVWTTVERSGDAITLRHVSPDGDQGFPGTVTVTVTFSVAGDQLSIATDAQTDAATVFGTTNHAYWNLAGRGTIDEHVLTAPASSFVDVDDELIPVSIVDVTSANLDLRTPTPVARLTSTGGVDHCLVFDDGSARAELSHPPSGRTMAVESNQPGLQVYTGQYLPTPFAGICLEPGLLPDTPSRPEFGSAVLRPGETYHHRAVYTFGQLP